jgi:hypothetical protein
MRKSAGKSESVSPRFHRLTFKAGPLYIHALRTVGVKDVLGKFNLRDRKCSLCKGRYQAHEENKTDINNTVTLLAAAVADNFDTALILFGDSDLAPVTNKLKELYPKKIGKGPVWSSSSRRTSPP